MNDPHTTPMSRGAPAPRTTSTPARRPYAGDGATPTPAGPATRVGPEPAALASAVARACDHLLARQHADGYWQGELEADASVTAGYIPIVYAVTGRIDRGRAGKAAAFVLSQQLPDGSWPTYHGGPGSVDVSVQAYFGLKMAGVDPADEAMRRARTFIVEHGGIERTNLMTKLWLAVFGQYPYERVPDVPPELMLLPANGPFSIYDVASWSRETLVALMIMTAQRVRFDAPPEAAVPELFAPGEPVRGAIREDGGAWPALFRWAERAARSWHRLPYKPMRAHALDLAEAWLVRHQERDGSWGGIMLPWMYAMFALRARGYRVDHPVLARGLQGLEDFVVEDATTMRLQPATSPVWDTAWSILALREAGVPGDHPALQRAGAWLLDREIRHDGDWKIKNPRVEAGGWSFEFANDWYPDLDDTPVVARALHGLRLPDELEPQRRAAVRRALAWALAMQCKDGGFAAFDRDNDHAFLVHAPFSDFVPPVDPACADVTAHVLELMATLGERGEAYRRTLAYLARAQEGDGAWYGRWGVAYLYGTGLALEAIAEAGDEPSRGSVERACAFLEAHQNEDGGWGETCGAYEDPGPSTRATGPSTASQTAWALIGLLGARGPEAPSVRRGLDYLVRQQTQGGDWQERATTGTGFPGTFYLRYDMYRRTFPLLALARAQRLAGG